ncbi:MAG: transcription antitermination factor NusB [Alphaproteobacteria bacterium]|nr:transcription antitermination factor NusB [Alphaproteobacteria bacterium]
MTVPTGKAKPRSSTRSAARLAAVQALYQMEMTGAGATAALADVRLRDGAVSDDAVAGIAVDEAMLIDLVEGVTQRREEIDLRISGHLVEGWSFERLELVLRAILRAGTYEIVARPDVPLRVAINEWVDLAHAFYSGKEPGFVNGVLDHIGREARPAEAR